MSPVVPAGLFWLCGIGVVVARGWAGHTAKDPRKFAVRTFFLRSPQLASTGRRTDKKTHRHLCVVRNKHPNERNERGTESLSRSRMCVRTHTLHNHTERNSEDKDTVGEGGPPKVGLVDPVRRKIVTCWWIEVWLCHWTKPTQNKTRSILCFSFLLVDNVGPVFNATSSTVTTSPRGVR